MARKIAQFSPEDVRAFVELGTWSNPSDADYVYKILMAEDQQICAADVARLRSLLPQELPR